MQAPERMKPSRRPRAAKPSRTPQWERLYDRCLELGVVGIEHRQLSLGELAMILEDRGSPRPERGSPG